MTTRVAAVKRLKWTLVLFSISMIAVILSYQSRAGANRHTDARVNAIVCVTRPYLEGQRARNLYVALHDPSPARRASARQAVQGVDQFLAGLITGPKHFNCEPYLKKLLEAAKHDEH